MIPFLVSIIIICILVLCFIGWVYKSAAVVIAIESENWRKWYLFECDKNNQKENSDGLDRAN